MTGKSDIENKIRVLKGETIQRRPEPAGFNKKPESIYSKIEGKSTPESLISILTIPELSYPVYASENINIINKLHNTYGNTYLQRFIQTKLQISQPNDKYEQEADRIADMVMRMPKLQMNRLPAEEGKAVSEVLPPNTLARQETKTKFEAPKKRLELSFKKPLIEPLIKMPELKLLYPLLIILPDLYEELAKKWAEKWLLFMLLQKELPPADILSQLIDAFKKKAEEWMPQGMTYATHPDRIEEIARLSVMKDYLKLWAEYSKKVSEAEPGKEEEVKEKAEEEILEKQLKQMSEKCLEALKTALEETKFWSKWKENVEENAKNNWPILSIFGGAALSGMLANAATAGEWEAVETVAGLLPSLVDTDIELDEHWQMLIAFKESPPIGKEGKGTVIGIMPQLGLRYTFDDGTKIEFFGNVNLRFATQEDAPFSMRYATFIGVKLIHY